MKKMNKVIAAMMMMAITTAMPAMAGNKNHPNNGKHDKTVVVTNNKKHSNFDKVDKKTTHFDVHKKHFNHPDVKTCTFKISHHASRHNVVAKAKRIKGVMDAHLNPFTNELTVQYDARATTARHIMHTLA